MTRDTLIAIADALDATDANLLSSRLLLATVRQTVQIELDATAGPPPIVVPAGGNLQAALDAAVPGQTIELAAGATFVGNFVLRQKADGDPITVVTSAIDELPADRRVASIEDLFMPTLRSANALPALRTTPGASRYRLIGLAFAAASSGPIVQLGDGVNTDPALVPSDLVLDRCIIRAEGTSKNGIEMNSAATTITNCHISGVKLQGQETHAIVCWNGPGPFLLENNHIEAGSIGVLFGGAAPTIPGLIPSDITFRRNLVTRPLEMRSQSGWAVKNLFELKNARRVTVSGNTFEHNWPDGQAGFAIVLTVRANSQTAAWSTIRDVLFESNTIRHVAMGFNVLGLDDAAPSQPMDGVIIQNNLIYDLDRVNWTGPTGTMGSGAFMQIDGAPRNLHVERNTAVGAVSGNILVLSGQPIPGFIFRRNIVQKLLVPYQTYGVFGNVVGEGNPAFARYCPDVVFTENVLAGCSPAIYSTQPGNLFPTIAQMMAEFEDPAAGNYRTDYIAGVDMDALEAAR